MNLRKILVVGAMVGAVMVGGAVAQPPSSSDANNTDLHGNREGSVGLSVNIESFAELTVTPGSMTEGTDLAFDVNGAVIGINTTAELTVRTNFANWDVTMHFANGGQLVKDGVPGYCAEYNSFGVCINDVPAIQGTPLKVLGTVDTLAARLVLRTAASDGTLSAELADTTLVGSDGGVNQIYGKIETSPISLAEVLGTKRSGVAPNTPIFGGTTRSADDVITDGFPGIGTSADTGAAAVIRVHISFGNLVDTGHGVSGFEDGYLAENPDGEYSETVFFNLYATY